ncbi:MAG: SpvB/TcaC N-terminal domain-containing protein [Byssovorax sp.]
MDDTRKPAPVKAPLGAARPSNPAPPGDARHGVKAPTPTLPKGGGAIRGIGEKFAANPVTGTGSMRVPIATSPSQGGAEPALKLRYDSGSGSGVFGSAGSPYRGSRARPTRACPRATARTSSFFRTPRTWSRSPTTCCQARSSRRRRAADAVVTYRPRVEGLFARIRRRVRAGRHHVLAGGDARQASLYGTTAQAQITDPEGAGEGLLPGCWKRPSTTEDNVLLYEYREEDLTNVVGTAPCEAPRLGGTAKITSRYLKRIRCGNRTSATPDATPESDPAASDFLFEVVFDFGEHDPDVPTVEAADPATWPVRQDPFSTFRSTFEVRTYRLCRRVLMFHRMSELGASPCLVASTDFTYDENPSLTKLVAVSYAGTSAPKTS